MWINNPKPTNHRCGIQVEDAVLSYPIGPMVQGSLKSNLFRVFGYKDPHQVNRPEYYTALRGVSFTIDHGERVALIGRNGAGKSTTLRAIAGIYPLERGRISVQGRVQGMFDFGLGFESDATGRENIRYQGLSMGCTPDEIDARTEEIIEFADIGTFIDMPVRMYSSGMGVRLAFAISTYLSGDVLLLDEVFGTGDASFQHKAAARMNSIVDAASILVLVSHDLELVRSICQRAIWIDGGFVRADGPADDVVKEYLSSVG